LKKCLTPVRFIANLIAVNREIIFHTTIDGKCPAQEFLDNLPKKIFKKIIWVLKIISELDKLPANYFKKFKSSEDIWECRIIFSSNIYRLLCFLENGSVIIVTHGFIKKTQKTPQEEIRKAEGYKKEYLRRM
jgi:phage-related protein